MLICGSQKHTQSLVLDAPYRTALLSKCSVEVCQVGDSVGVKTMHLYSFILMQILGMLAYACNLSALEVKAKDLQS